jgi:transposase-like protein
MRQEEFERLLASLDDLSLGQKAIVRKVIDKQQDLEKVIFIIESRFIENPVCPRCQSENVKRWGRANNLQRFRCSSCGRTFNPLTGTPLANLRKKDQWLTMAGALKQGLPLRRTADKCDVSLTTAFRWRHRFLEAASLDKPDKLDGIAEADETYFLESFKGSRSLPRPPRRRGGKAAKRGLSSEQVPVLVARDRHGHTLDAILPDQSKDSVKQVLKGALTADNILCIDGGSALRGFANDLNIPYRVISPNRKVHKMNPIFHIQNVNGYHSRLKSWMARFNGVATKYLGSYLGWRRVYEHQGASITDVAWLQTAIGRNRINA